MTQVQIKRLPHCFAITEKGEKLRSLKAYFEMFPRHIKKLAQFDEVPNVEYDLMSRKVFDGTITEAEMDKVMRDGDIPPLPYPMKDYPQIQVPVRATQGSAGFDLQAAIDEFIEIAPGESAIVPTGLCVSTGADDIELQVRPRSGLAAKNQVTVVNTPGTVDSDYTGEIKVILINHGKETFIIKRGDRIAQAVFNRIYLPTLLEVEELKKTDRGASGFGSTGR